MSLKRIGIGLIVLVVLASGGYAIFGRSSASSAEEAEEAVADVSAPVVDIGQDTVSAEGSTTGRFFSERSFGCLGFTGTSIWADPERDLGVVLLTNRVHPTRENQGIRALRPAFHDAVSKAIRN